MELSVLPAGEALPVSSPLARVLDARNPAQPTYPILSLSDPQSRLSPQLTGPPLSHPPMPAARAVTLT